MKKKYLQFEFWFFIALMSFFCSSAAFGQATLKHSYTFEDGTAKDVVGSADGTLVGGTISGGAYTAAGGGEYIILPAATINLNTYTAITLESYFYADVDNTGATMMAYFGKSVPNPTVGDPDIGADYLFVTPDRLSESYTGISCGNETNPWSTENGIKIEPAVTVKEKHHLVTIVTSTEIKFYIDGLLKGSAALSGNNSIANLSNEDAYLCKGGYKADPTWAGTIHEFNIYDGTLGESTIAQHAGDFLDISITNANLSALTTNTGIMTPAFAKDTTLYELWVVYGITSVTLSAVPEVEGAGLQMFDGLGSEITDGVVSFAGDGTDVEIVVTALDGSTEKSYFVSIFVKPGSESANLSSISLSTGNIIEDFHPDSLVYTAVVPYGTTSVNVTGDPSWAGALVAGGGAVTITDGEGTATLTVTSEDGKSSKVYTVNLYASKVAPGHDYYLVHEASQFVAEESLETYNVVFLQHALKDKTTQLFHFIESGVAGQYYIKNQETSYLSLSPSSDWDMIMLDTLTQDKDSCRFILHEFEPGRFRIESLVKSATEQKFVGTNSSDVGSWIYSDKYIDNKLAIWNILPPDEVVDPYDTYLSSLSVDIGNISPAFDMFTNDYYISLPIATTTLTVSGTPNDPTSVVTGTGAIDVSAGKGTITVTVTATDPDYKKEYRIHYIKDTPLTMTHSYTFADGTAEDVVGDADGTVYGGRIWEGVYTASNNGDYISLPADEIAINSYPSITIETYLMDVDTTTNDVNTMISYFGNTTGSYGNDYFFTSLKSRVAISCENAESPWGTETGVDGTNVLDDNMPHHLVSVLSYDTIRLYLDGTLIGKTAVSEKNKIYNLSNTFAYICKSGYTGDKTWLGQILEFNIYSGQMDAATVAAHAYSYPLEDSATDATLADLMLDDVTIDGFASYQLGYDVVMPRGTSVIPTVTATPRYSNQTAVVTPATAFPGTTTVLVTAPNGTTQNTYEVNFSIAVSLEASLSDLTVNGTTIAGFDPEILTYDVVLADTVTSVPVVAGTPDDSLATVVVNAATSLPGTTTIVVTAEDGETVLVYTINFSLDISKDATLADLTVDGTTITGFDPSKINYIVNLASGTSTVPTVVGTPNDNAAKVVVNPAASIPGTTTVVVTAADGTTKKTYSVSFAISSAVGTLEEFAVTVYPTVTDGDFKVRTSEKINAIRVHDITGKLVIHQTDDEIDYSIQVPHAGMYFIEIECNGVSKIFKVFKTN